MREPWADIVARFGEKQAIGDAAFRSAMAGIERVAVLIAQQPDRLRLFGWTSMHDLCVQQTDAAPYAGPYLRLSSLASGMVEFRYVDTATADRQWRRVVTADAAPARFLDFVDRLGWAAAIVPTRGISAS